MPGAIRFGLEGRVAVITGAAQGIGAACARRLAAEGAAVALWDVADDAGHALAAELGAAGARCLYRHCNVASKADVDAALAETVQTLGTVDALVNNVGVNDGVGLDGTYEQFMLSLKLNLARCSRPSLGWPPPGWARTGRSAAPA